MDQPKVAIIILNWNGLEDTIECLESLKKVSYTNYQIYVVDNGSTGNDVAVLKERFPDYIQIIENDKNYGFTGGNNIAIKYILDNSPPDYFLLLNNDTVVDTKFVTEMVDVAREMPQSGMVGPKTYLYEEPDRFWLVWFTVDIRSGKVNHIGSGEIDKGQYDTIREIDYIPGSCMLIKQEVINNVGLFKERYFAYWEETDYCLRTRNAGYRIYNAPKAKIWHKVSKTSKKSTGFYLYYFTRNGFWFVKEHASRYHFYKYIIRFLLTRFWFVSGVLLLYRRDVKSLVQFYRAISDGIFKK